MAWFIALLLALGGADLIDKGQVWQGLVCFSIALCAVAVDRWLDIRESEVG